VDGNLTRIYVTSGEQVKTGQPLMEIDPTKQRATVAQIRATEAQKKATYDYNTIQVDRQRKLYADGVVSKSALDLAEQGYQDSKADYESSGANLKAEEQQLSYYHIVAPFDGIVGDIPAHVGDYVSPSTMLTTVDQRDDLEIYIYIPTSRVSRLHKGLPVELRNNEGELLDTTSIDFISPQVDSQLQGILAKAPVKNQALRSMQMVNAKVIWDEKPMPQVPILAVSRIGGQQFVFVAEPGANGGYVARQRAIQLGDTVGNNYSVLSGLNPGDKVIVSGTQFLVDGAPVAPMG
jgi:RND family efflux transporter MFP subunit